ncbi:MAG: class I SAM-dependent DNA methyltransferase [Bacteroidota bacterium]
MNPHDNWANYYDEVYELTYRGGYSQFTNLNLQLIEAIMPNGSILDYGAGTGRLAIPLAQKGFPVIAVEQSSAMAESFKNKCTATGLEIPIHNCKIADYFNGKGDLALAVFTVLSYIVDEEEMVNSLDTIAKHLNPKGYFFFDLPDPVFFNRPVLFDINRPDFTRRVTITPTEEGQIFMYGEEGSLELNGEIVNYEEEFPIRKWEWKTINNFLEHVGLRDTGRNFPSLANTGSTYKLYQKSQ